MNYAEAIQFLFGLQMFGSKLGLDSTRRLAELAGNPERQLRFIHVAGTNGKGSTCAMLESIYRAAGLRVGLFTSPHLVSFAERIQVNRRLIPDAELVRIASDFQLLLRQFSAEDHPTFFEVVTVMAARYFAEQACDLVIWETGLGGRLDATNIVTPLASVITNVGFDHQQWLGDTLEKIAAEKAGIIKPGVPVITSAEPGRGLEVITKTAQQLDAPLTVVDQSVVNEDAIHTENLPLAGDHQRLNAVLARETVRVVGKQIPVAPDAVTAGLSNVNWPGRMQLVNTSGGQTLLLDGAHNIPSAEALVSAFKGRFVNVRPTLILGVLADKDWCPIAEILAPVANRLLLVPVSSQRTLPPEKLLPVCKAANPQAAHEICASLADALARSAKDEFVLITGSLYLVGEAIERLQLSQVPPSDERGLNEWTAAR